MGTSWQLEALKISAELAYTRGQQDVGYNMLKNYHHEYTELLLKNASERLLKVRTNLEAERHEVAQALEDERLQVTMLKVEQKQSNSVNKIYFNMFSTGVALFVLIVIFLQYRTNRKMHSLTIKDSLSGLYNRRYIFDYLNNQVLINNVDKLQLSVILIDVDDFKKINDGYGHPVGDDIIRYIAKLGEDVFRRDDIFGRIGGEEFMCVLPQTSVTEAKEIAEHFLALINRPITVKNYQHTVTVSIGIAALSTEYESIEQLYINADKALYQAKHLGKNQVNVF